MTKTTEKKQEFATGATRNDPTGKGRYDLISAAALHRLALVYERGAARHGDRNWENGIPVSRFLDSAIRHLVQFAGGLRDEDHLAQAAWNVFALIHTEEKIANGELPAELDDLPGGNKP